MNIPRKLSTAALSLILSLVVIVMAACGNSSPGGKVTLRYTLWIGADTPQIDLLKKMAQEYNTLHPTVNVTFDSIPFADYQSTVTLQLAGKNPPDAGWIVERTAPSWEKTGVLTDLGPTLHGDSAYNFGDFSTSALGLWTNGQTVYGIPFSNSPFIVMYNADLFKKAGTDTPDQLIAQGKWTWENLALAAKKIKDATGTYGFQNFDGALYTSNFWGTLVPVMRAYGGDAWSDTYQCGFTSAGSVAALQLIHDMIFKDKSAVPPGTQADFYSGGAGMMLGQLSRVNKLSSSHFTWSIAPLPSGPAGYHPVVGQAAMVVFKNSPHQAEALDFIKFLTTQQNVGRLAQYFPPARASVLGSDTLAKANPLVPSALMQSTVIDPIKNGKVLPAHPNLPAIELTLTPLLDKLWTPNADVPGVAASLCAGIDPLLKA